MGFFKLLGLLALAASHAALAFTLNTSGSTLKGWDTKTLTVDYNFTECPTGVSQDTLLGIVDRAFETWNGVPTSSIRLERGAAVTTTATTAAAATSGSNPLIVCDASFSSRVSASEIDVVPGLTINLRLDPNTAQIVFGAVVLNAQSGAKANIGNVSSDELTIVLAHEIGHLLGIGHSEDPNALMYYDLTGKKSPSLSMDDMDAMSFLYPRSEPFGSGMMGCNSVSAKGSGGSGPGATELGLLLAMAWLAVAAARSRARSGVRTIS